ncbi:hypothetical protein GH157_02540 [archaeon]|nr:hypothetical protein [archaeon]
MPTIPLIVLFLTVLSTRYSWARRVISIFFSFSVGSFTALSMVE